jgi:putative transposase
MALPSYGRHRFPASITLSYRDVEDLLAERGLDISYETVWRWVLKFGPLIARKLRQRRPRPSDRWHLDEMVVRIAGRRMYLWRASITRAKSSTCWFSAGATSAQRCG